MKHSLPSSLPFWTHISVAYDSGSREPGKKQVLVLLLFSH